MFRFFSRTSKESQYESDEEFFLKLRQKEFSRIDTAGHVYLDFTGGNLYPQSLVLQHQTMLLNQVLGNPHSSNPTSHFATEKVEEARAAVLRYFGAEDYTCIFTPNASGALKIVGESYPFDENSVFILTADNHNSVNGIRDFCTKKGGQTHYVPVQYEDLMIPEAMLKESLARFNDKTNKLFAFPAQSNVSGVKHDLKWIAAAQQKGFDVLLDAAAFVPSSRLDLSVVKPDFVSVSFYKIFGYPTGIGCLLVRNSTLEKLVKPWFAGGTVTLVSVASQSRFLASGHERFEDGTINYTELPAIKLGLEFIQSIGIERINQHVLTAVEYLANRLRESKHSNGAPMVKIFGPYDFSRRGGNIILNILDPDGRAFSFQLVEEAANARKISIRTGCFCNPGIDEINNCLSNNELATYFTSRDCGNYYDMIAFLGKMRGAIRVSVGLATVKADLDAFLRFVASYSDKNASGTVSGEK